MNETMVTLVGNAATGPIGTETALGHVVRLRLAVTARRFDREQQAWTDGPTSFYTVWARRSLAANLSSSVDVGDPLVVHGRLRVKDETRDGERRFSADVDALAVGHDMTRGTSAFRRVAKADPSLVEPAAVRAADPRAQGAHPAHAARTAHEATTVLTLPLVPEVPPGWAADTPVSWAARGAPDRTPDPTPDPTPDGAAVGAADREPERKPERAATRKKAARTAEWTSAPTAEPAGAVS